MEPVNFKHHGQLYFADGNIVLIARTAADERVAFRVHQSVMARNSPIFADMLSLPLSGAVESYDGVPFVRMPDPAEDLERLLQVLYIQPMLQIKRFDSDTPLIVKPLLILANKYEIQHLRANIIQKLEEDWPRTLSEWDEIEHYAEGKAKTCVQDVQWDRTCDDFPDLHLPEAASAINLSHACNVPNILPAAFYHLSRISILHDWDRTHVALEDNGIPDYSDLVNGARTARWNLLSKEDFICLLTGRERLKDAINVKVWTEHNAHVTHPHPNEDYGGCKSKYWSKVWDVVERACRESSDVLKTLRDVVDILQSSGNPALCYSCEHGIKKGIDEVRNEIWNGLHDYFDLPLRA
ncbi:hypothetical protein EWM64_g3228 [Hericium alpestre]|uniref:BTB domain-containing protein n=1 Tax=Hericium alpestre TaxID=135208 RepID=A0A4Z0A3H5_9AGAM|nr:hypothetical protein EWM64_g3228 [Hericium alpestre]